MQEHAHGEDEQHPPASDQASAQSSSEQRIPAETPTGEPVDRPRTPSETTKRLPVRLRLRNRLIEMNLPAAALILLALIGLVAVIGDMPTKDSERPPIQPTLAFQTETRDTYFVSTGSHVNVNAALPFLPTGQARFSGEVVLNGLSLQPGELTIYIILVRPADVTYEVTRAVGIAEAAKWRILDDSEIPPSRFGLPEGPKLTVGKLKFKSNRPCARISVLFWFSVSNGSFSHNRGWGRQELLFSYQPPLESPTDSSHRQAEQECHLGKDYFRTNFDYPGYVALRPGDRQRIEAVSPTPDKEFGTGPFWTLPKDGEELVAHFTVENALGRFVANFASQLLLFAAGGLVGAAAVQVRRQRPSR